MGLPDIPCLLRLPRLKQLVHVVLHVIGVMMWIYLLPSLTQGCRYSAVIHYLPDL